MKIDLVFELIDTFVPADQREAATRFLLTGRNWGGARANSGQKKGCTPWQKKQIKDFKIKLEKPDDKQLKSEEKAFQDSVLKSTKSFSSAPLEKQKEQPSVPTVQDFRKVVFSAGFQNWEFPKTILAEAKKHWKPETIRAIEIDFCCREYETRTTIDELLTQWPADIESKAAFIVPDTRFTKPWLEWLDYKKSKRQGYKPASLPKVWKQLITLSGNNPAVAQQVVDQSIANGWQGLFALKAGAATAQKNLTTAGRLTEWAKQ